MLNVSGQNLGCVGPNENIHVDMIRGMQINP